MSAHEKTKSLLKGVEEQLALSRNAVVEVGAGVAGAVDIAFGRMQAQLRRDYCAGNFNLNGEGVIVYTDGSGYAVPAM